MKTLNTEKCAELVNHVLKHADNEDTEKMVKQFLK